MHGLRHTFCTLMYLAGVDVVQVCTQMGHAAVSTTLRIYTHLDAIHKRASVSKLDTFLEAQLTVKNEQHAGQRQVKNGYDRSSRGQCRHHRDGNWHRDAVAFVFNKGIMGGYSDTEFRPSREIRCERLASILYRYAQLKGCDTREQADFCVRAVSYRRASVTIPLRLSGTTCNILRHRLKLA